MKKFRVEIERTDIYEIEFDENICNQKFIEDFKKNFYNFDSLKEHAEHIATHRARFGQSFIEGYGIPLVNGNAPFMVSDNDSSLERGINIKTISEDDFSEMWVNSKEI